MSVQVQCPNPACGRIFVIPETLLGRTGRCDGCGTKFPLAAAPSAGTSSAAHATTPAPAAATAADGSQRIGRFQVRARLGAGAFGTVYRAYDPQLERDVALKVPNAGILDNPKRVERFLREAKSAAQLRHPNLVPVYDAGQDGAQHYIASAFIEGKPLADAVEETGLAFDRAARIVGELAEALAYAHALGIVHRDIKPANIMLDAEDQPLLMDFGLAARLESTEKLTHEGAVLGTPSYMAPEQAAGQQGEAKAESDQYSLGVVLYELLTGRTPFEGPPQVVLYNVIHQEPPRPSTIRKDLPRDLETICLKAMAKRPEDRYAGCQALADDLRRWREGEPIRARRLGLVERLVRYAQREPKLAAAGAMTLASLVAVGVLLAMLLAQKITELASESAKREQAEAELNAERQELGQMRRNQYVQLITLAAREADANDLPGTLRHLAACRPDQRGWEWHHLRLRGEGAAVRLLLPHEGVVAAMAFRADSRYLVNFSPGGAVKIWDVLTGREVRSFRLKEPVDWGMQLAVSGDGRRLLTWHGTGPRPRPIRPVGVPPREAKGDEPAKPQHQDVVVWDAQNGDWVSIIRLPLDHRLHAALSADGKRVAVAAAPQEGDEPAGLKVYDAETGKELVAFEQRFKHLRHLTFRPGGHELATVAGEPDKPAEIKFWDAETGKERRALDGRMDGITHLVFSPDGKQLAGLTGGDMPLVVRKVIVEITKPVTVTEEVVLPNGDKEQRQVTKHVTELVEKEVTEQLASGAGRVQVWDADTGKPTLTVHGPCGQVTSLAFSPDGRRLATACADACAQGPEVRLWDAHTGEPLLLLKTPDGAPITALLFSPDGQHLAGASNGSIAVTLWSAHSGRIIATYSGHGGPVCSVAWSPDGQQISSHSSCNETAKLWEAATGKEMLTITHTPIPLAFSSAGDRMSSGCYGAHGDHGMGGYGWQGSCYGMSGGCYGMLGGAGYGMLGSGCVGGFGGYGGHGCYGWSPSLKVWDRSALKQIAPPNGVGRILSVSPDGKLFAAVPIAQASEPAQPDQQPEIHVWDAQAEKVVCTLKGLHDGATVAFSPDGKRLASFQVKPVKETHMKEEVRVKDGKQETIKVPYEVEKHVRFVTVWDIGTGAVLLTHDGASGVLAFSPDGSFFASASAPPPPTPPAFAPKVMPGEQPQPMPVPAPPPPPPEVVVWNAPTGERLHTFKGLPSAACTVQFSPDSKSLAAFCPGGSPRVEEIEEKRRKMVDGKWEEYRVKVKVIVPNPSMLKVWSAQTGKELLAHEGASGVFAFHPDGKRLASAAGSAAPKLAPGVMPMPAGEKIPPPIEKKTAPAEKDGSADDESDKPKPPKGEPLPVPMPLEGPEPVPAGMPDTAWPTIKVFDLAAGRELLTLTGHTSPISTLAYSPDGSRLASANWGGGHAAGVIGHVVHRGHGPAPLTSFAKIKVWDAEVGHELLTFEGHTGRVNCLAFSPDGRRIASASEDKTVKVWLVTLPAEAAHARP